MAREDLAVSAVEFDDATIGAVLVGGKRDFDNVVAVNHTPSDERADNRTTDLLPTECYVGS